jgi:hypothetical protein
MSEGHGHGHAHGHGGHADAPSQKHGLGISRPAVIFILVSLVVVMWQGSNIVRSAGDAHVWPSADAAKVPLPPEQH